VIVVRGATRMRWDRWQHWTAGDQRWRFEVMNTDSLTHRQTAEAVLAWVTDVLAVRRPSLSGRWWQR
jgi:hypothetical protein